jgi:hypothetical protein
VSKMLLTSSLRWKRLQRLREIVMLFLAFTRLLPDGSYCLANTVSIRPMGLPICGTPVKRNMEGNCFVKSHPDMSWQSQQEGAFRLSDFQIDWDVQTVTCPQGKISRNWNAERGPRNKPTIQVRFHKADCLACPTRVHCTHSTTAPRELTLHPARQPTWLLLLPGESRGCQILKSAMTGAQE